MINVVYPILICCTIPYVNINITRSKRSKNIWSNNIELTIIRTFNWTNNLLIFILPYDL